MDSIGADTSANTTQKHIHTDTRQEAQILQAAAHGAMKLKRPDLSRFSRHKLRKFTQHSK